MGWISVLMKEVAGASPFHPEMMSQSPPVTLQYSLEVVLGLVFSSEYGYLMDGQIPCSYTLQDSL